MRMTLDTLHKAIWLFWLSQPSLTAAWQKNGLVNQWKQAACTSLVSRLGGTMTLTVNHLLPLTNEEPSHCQLMSLIGLSSVKQSDLRFAFGSWWLSLFLTNFNKMKGKPKKSSRSDSGEVSFLPDGNVAWADEFVNVGRVMAVSSIKHHWSTFSVLNRPWLCEVSQSWNRFMCFWCSKTLSERTEKIQRGRERNEDWSQVILLLLIKSSIRSESSGLEQPVRLSSEQYHRIWSFSFSVTCL